MSWGIWAARSCCYTHIEWLRSKVFPILLHKVTKIAHTGSNRDSSHLMSMRYMLCALYVAASAFAMTTLHHIATLYHENILTDCCQIDSQTASCSLWLLRSGLSSDCRTRVPLYKPSTNFLSMVRVASGCRLLMYTAFSLRSSKSIRRTMMSALSFLQDSMSMRQGVAQVAVSMKHWKPQMTESTWYTRLTEARKQADTQWGLRTG